MPRPRPIAAWSASRPEIRILVVTAEGHDDDGRQLSRAAIVVRTPPGVAKQLRHQVLHDLQQDLYALGRHLTDVVRRLEDRGLSCPPRIVDSAHPARQGLWSEQPADGGTWISGRWPPTAMRASSTMSAGSCSSALRRLAGPPVTIGSVVVAILQSVEATSCGMRAATVSR